MAGEKEKVSRISPVSPGNVELGKTVDVWENIEMVSRLSPVSISSTFLGETGNGCEQAGKTEKVSKFFLYIFQRLKTIFKYKSNISSKRVIHWYPTTI